ncbi:MAG: hypothetical protein IPM39_25115 [Chloroflexi bacterium]|nr:hypothetical protein [Chloroflexota bacterium]
MTDLPWDRQLFYRYLGLAYAFTHWTSHKTFLAATVRGWIQFAALVLLLVSLLLRWGVWGIGGTAVFLLWVRFSYWRAQKAGYSRFVPDTNGRFVPDASASLRPYQRAALQATGVYHVTELSQAVLLRPAEYWQAPLGQHIVMVEHRRQKYLYQFFDARTLQQVQKGWLIFGVRPLDSLAVTFVSAWVGDEVKPVVETIYFSFADAAGQTAVWQTIIKDVRS